MALDKGYTLGPSESMRDGFLHFSCNAETTTTTTDTTTTTTTTITATATTTTTTTTPTTPAQQQQKDVLAPLQTFPPQVHT